MSALTYESTDIDQEELRTPILSRHPSVLVVDDNPVDRRLTGGLVEKKTDYQVHYARNGVEALETIAEHHPSIVLTDMLMPEMDGLELVENIRKNFPLIPVILITAYGSEEIAIQALQRGAASYVPKKSLVKEIAPRIEQVLAAAQATRDQRHLLECMKCEENQFELDNDPTILPALIASLQCTLERMKIGDQTGRIRVGIALEEALTNSINHGNLELSSELRQDGTDAYQRMAFQRRHEEPYCNRRVYVTARATRFEAKYVIRDDGPGFDPSTLPDPTDPANLGRVGGRGMLLIRTFMDDVTYNQTGNEITMVKRNEEAA